MKFHICTIITIVTGRLVSPNHMGDIYEILNFMTGDSLFTHQLPRVRRECKPYLLDQFPQLVVLTDEVMDQWRIDSEETLAPFTEAMVAQYGKYHEVQPIPMDDHDVIDPMEELKGMVDESKIIQVNISEEEPPSDIGDINWKVD